MEAMDTRAAGMGCHGRSPGWVRHDASGGMGHGPPFCVRWVQVREGRSGRLLLLKRDERGACIGCGACVRRGSGREYGTGTGAVSGRTPRPNVQVLVAPG
jgi:hypothetical protein